MARPLTASERTLTALDAGSAQLGWHGRGLARAHEGSGLSIVMDGAVLNRRDIGNTGVSDAAIVADLYRRHGFVEAVQQINGDFAIALFDRRECSLWLARDRFGIKPLYHVRRRDTFAFASRPLSLLALEDIPREPSMRYVALFAGSHYRYFDTNPTASPWEAIRQLPAGHVMKVTPDGATVSAYWALEDQGNFDEKDPTLVEQYRQLLLDAVGLRLAGASRPIFTLSGGMDSSSVLASAAFLSGARQSATSVVYDDRTYDESDDIKPMLDGYVDRWHPVPVGTPDVFGLLERMIAVHDEPVATATWLSHFLLCERIAQAGFGTVFGGLGGDELNAGEYEYFLFHFADLRAAGDAGRLDREIDLWVKHHDHPVFRKNRQVVEDGLARLIDPTAPGRCRADRTRLERYAATLRPGFYDLRGFEPVMDTPFDSCLKTRAFQDLTRETLPCCLRASDRNQAAFGLEGYLPFLDHRLVEFMFKVPGTLKIRDGVTKHLLREATRGILPETTRTRVKKTGWNAPAHRWFTGPGRERVLDLVRSQTFRERGIYEPREVERLVVEHDAIVASGEPRENHMMFLWQVVNLELWLRSSAR